MQLAECVVGELLLVDEDLIAQLEAEQIASLGKAIPDFKPGDTIRAELFPGYHAANRPHQVRPELHDVMTLVVDVMLQGFMKRSVDMLKMNFIVRKVADGAVATCKAATRFHSRSMRRPR